MTISYISTLKTSIEKESVSIEFRPIEIDETRNYTLEEIKCNGLMRSITNCVELWIVLGIFLLLFLLSVDVF